MKRGTPAIQLVLLCLILTSAFVGRTSMGPLQETMRSALGLSDNAMALLQGPPLAIGVVCAIPVGLLFDRYRRVPLVPILAFLGVLGVALSASATRFTMLFVSRCLTGISAAAIWTVVLSLISDWYPSTQRGRATTLAAMGAVVGMSGTFALGGVLLGAASFDRHSWRLVLLGLATLPVMGLALTPVLCEPARAESQMGRISLRRVYPELWRRRALLFPLLLGSALVGGVADGAVVIWAAPVLSRAFSLSPRLVGLLMAAVLFITGMLGPVVGGALCDWAQHHGGPPRTLKTLSALMLVALPTGLFPLAPSVISMSFGLTLFLLIGTALQVSLFALATVVIEEELRASTIAWMFAVNLLFAYGVAPLLVSHLAEVLGGDPGLRESLAAVGVTSCLAGIMALWSGRRSFGCEPSPRIARA